MKKPSLYSENSSRLQKQKARQSLDARVGESSHETFRNLSMTQWELEFPTRIESTVNTKPETTSGFIHGHSVA